MRFSKLNHCLVYRFWSTFSWFFTTLTFIGILSCSEGTSVTDEIPGDEPLEASSPLLKQLPSEETGITFQNFINETFEMNITTHINTSNGGGVAIFDANNDGLQDVYFISSSTKNLFYLNKGNLKFEDKTDVSGLASGEGFEIAVTAVDINTDGLMDLYVCRAGPVVNEERRNKLFVNNGDLTFTDRAKEYGLDDKSASVGANFFDYDNDGDLDLYLLNYPVDFSFSSKINVRPTADGKTVEPILDPINEYDSDRLYRNDGPPDGNGKGGFKDVSKESGIWNFAYGLSVSVEDFNHDGWQDIYVANDFIQPDILYINNRNGTFTDKLKSYFKHTSQHTMGTDLSDFDNDGLFDLYAVDMLSNTQYRRKTLQSTNTQNKYTTLIRHGYFEPVARNVLQRNNGNQTFSDIACMANVFQTDWSWSALMVDLDNDGWKDILVTNGYQREVTDIDFINFTFAGIKAKGDIKEQYTDIHQFLDLIPKYKLRDFVFKNNGDLTFEDKSGQWMTVNPTWSNGAATSDLDNDGDLDYIVNNINDEAFVYENLATAQSENNYLQFKCNGPGSNPFGVGTSIHLYSQGQHQYQLLNPTRGIFSSIEHLLHFGLGTHSTVDSVVVQWPGGNSQIIKNVKSNQRIILNYSEATNSISVHPLTTEPTMFSDITKMSKLNFKHQENDYLDFEISFLMPWTLSDLGPLMATSDVNGDGWTDVFVGNSFGKPGGLFLQNPDGTFELMNKSQWDMDSIYEEHGSLFFDADMDKDLDLMIISGGYEATAPQAWQSRLYINDGGKKFIPAPGAIPLLEGVGLRADAFDYDQDGDQDIFIGGRVTPGKYPVTPKSFVLRNDRNKFVDVTQEVAPEFGQTGMVSDLKFSNVDSDPLPELIVVGEWMPITIFNITNGKLIIEDEEKTGLKHSNGFWNKLNIADVDGDGDQDLVTGNLGLNTHYKPTSSSPVKCYVADYDQNGSIDPIITYFEGDKAYPIVQKDVLIKQLPVLKKKYVFYKDYAKATIEDVLTAKQIKESQILESYIVESGWWENNNGHFEFHKFPYQAQASPIQGIIVHDFNSDGFIDLMLAGNKYGMEVETGRVDAGIGTLLEGDGKGQFIWKNNIETGFWASGNVRDLALLSGPQKQARIIVSNNNDFVQVYELKK